MSMGCPPISLCLTLTPHACKSEKQPCPNSCFSYNLQYIYVLKAKLIVTLMDGFVLILLTMIDFFAFVASSFILETMRSGC